MKKIVILLTLSLLIISSFSCKKDDTESGYTVVYKLDVENHSGSKISWIGLNNERKEVINPTYPWQMEYSGLNSGDSIAMNFEVEVTSYVECSLSWSVKLTGGGELGDIGETRTYTSSSGAPLEVDFEFKIP